jgi:hypothetical protein
VDEFHATDFYACEGKWKTWKPKKDSPAHTQLRDRFAKAAHLHLPFGMALGLDLYHYADILGDTSFNDLKTPHDRMPPATWATFNLIGDMVGKAVIPFDATVAVLIEAGTGVGETIKWLEDLQKLGEPWMRAVESIGTVKKARYEVQAADLLAYEAGREIEDDIDALQRGINEARSAFRILAHGTTMPLPSPRTKKVDVRFATHEHFRATARNLNALKKGPLQRYKRTPAELRRRSKVQRRKSLRKALSWVLGKIRRRYYAFLGWLR